MRWPIMFALLCPVPAFAADPPQGTKRGKEMIASYFHLQAKGIANSCLNDLTTRADWESRVPKLRQQFFEMMGLWPLPAKSDLKPVITSTVEADTYRVEKLHFQSLPGLYVTANLYLPKGEVKNAPAILYVCGHGTVVENGISYGSKAAYQYHPAWFASHGFVCLILDTLQLHEIPGLHHGTYREGMWWWHNLGYTPGGIELWNAIRALDYLETRSEVDSTKFGLTGRSGGGATSWWLAAADVRIKAAVPVAGITDLTSHIANGAQDGTPERLKAGVIAGHCDCMYPVNLYRWDFAQIAALIAPRPLLLGNSDADSIFPVEGYRNVAKKARAVYELYGAGDKFQLLETKGPHKDTPELRIGINRWMNRWLKNDTTTVVRDDLPERLEPQQLRVLDSAPPDAINTTIHERLIPIAQFPIAQLSNMTADSWGKQELELIKKLSERVFAGWSRKSEPVIPQLAGELVHDGIRLQAYDFTSEDAIELRLFAMSADAVKPKRVILSVLDETAWQTWCRDLGPKFATLLQYPVSDLDQQKWSQNRAVMKNDGVCFAAIAPRGIGGTRWAVDGSVDDIQIRRRFPLIGQTLDGQRVWDARRAIQTLHTIHPQIPLRIHGERETAIIGYYAGLFEESVTDFDLWHPPASHRNGPIFLNIARILDVPQAFALSKRPVVIHTKQTDRESWNWLLQLQNKIGLNTLKISIDHE